MKTTASKVDKKSGETSGFRQVAVISLVAFIAALAYAVVRYHVIKGVPWDDFPLYILNKAVSLAAVFLIAMSYEFGPLARFLPRVFVPLLPARKYLGLLGFGLAAVHAVMSLLLFSPAYYPKFFSDG
ncbi:hypothetical protein HYU18_01810, partial [Candidatus Woesearchaeota archaeon]|nr:hypothetical protein [Candidatus Woesearchaeota archaeon]